MKSLTWSVANSAINMSEETNFGFKKVATHDKESLVGKVFSSVAKKYDLMNDLMSAGAHRLWKNSMVEEIKFTNSPYDLMGENKQNYRAIDLAGGTGDIAFRITKKARKENVNCKIDVVDINQEMLDVGKKRAVDLNLFSDLKFTCCNGEKLSFDDGIFDFFTIAFGIRNFTNPQAGLNEAYRVLKPGGKFVCLEFSKVNDYFLQKFYDFYSFKLIPKIGAMVLKDRESYQYLVESIRKFPSQDQFKKMIEQAGFKNVRYQNLSFGTVAIHVGEK